MDGKLIIIIVLLIMVGFLSLLFFITNHTLVTPNCKVLKTFMTNEAYECLLNQVNKYKTNLTEWQRRSFALHEFITCKQEEEQAEVFLKYPNGTFVNVLLPPLSEMNKDEKSTQPKETKKFKLDGNLIEVDFTKKNK